VCGLVLLQHGKGADMGAAFGSGSSGSLFGAAGSGELPVANDGGPRRGLLQSSLGLTYLGSMHAPAKDVMQQGVMGNMPKSEAPAPGQPPASTPAPVPSSTPAPSSEAPTPGEVPNVTRDQRSGVRDQSRRCLRWRRIERRCRPRVMRGHGRRRCD
jgi:preprotein translocase subunit SecG